MNPKQSDVSRIKIGQHTYGIVGIKHALEALSKTHAKKPDEAVAEELLRQLSNKNYIPEINQSGFVKIIRSLNVLTGEGPHFILEGTSNSVKNINRLFHDEDFHKLKRLLLFLVNGYKTKVLAPTGRFENELFEIFRRIDPGRSSADQAGSEPSHPDPDHFDFRPNTFHLSAEL